MWGATCQPETCDLYLRHGCANAAAISRKLRNEHLTRTVVEVAPGKGASLDLRGSEASVAMDENARAQATGRHAPDAPYVRILCSYPFDTVKALLQASPDAELVLFDDGLGSYGGDILRDNGGSGPPRPAALYVSAPELCHSSANDVIRKLPFSLGDRRLADTLQRIFAVDYAQLAPYHGKHCVFLTQPVDAYAERAEMDRRVLELFDPHEREVIVRPYPRDTSPLDPRIASDESGIPGSSPASQASWARARCCSQAARPRRSCPASCLESNRTSCARPSSTRRSRSPRSWLYGMASWTPSPARTRAGNASIGPGRSGSLPKRRTRCCSEAGTPSGRQPPHAISLGVFCHENEVCGTAKGPHASRLHATRPHR